VPHPAYRFITTASSSLTLAFLMSRDNNLIGERYMPFEHVIDHGSRLVVVRGSGEGSVEETADSVRPLLEDQSIRRDYSFMFVVSDTALHPAPDQMWTIASFLETMLSRFSGRMTIVASEVGKISAAHMIAFGADKGVGRLRVFTSESQARGWLLQATPE
jgi:hypothetical protein